MRTSDSYDLEMAILRLGVMRKYLSFCDIGILVFTAVHVGTVLVLLASRMGVLPPANLAVLFLFELSLVGAVFCCVLIFELARRRGDVIFEEISDELQWFVSRKYSESPTSKSDDTGRPPMNYRVALRDYLRSTEMFLAPIRAAPLMYLAMNVALFVISFTPRSIVLG